VFDLLFNEDLVPPVKRDLFVSTTATSLGSQIFKLPQSRHPERSALQIYRKQSFMARSGRTPGDACWQMLSGAFRPQATTLDKKV
jgi:hypothetical protein